MGDRFIKGLIAGLAGGITMNLWNFFAFYVLKLTEHRLLDWSSVYSMGRPPHNLMETIFMLIAQLSWSAFLGIIFVYLLPLISLRFLLVKGLVFGYISGFIMWSIPTLFQTPFLISMTFGTVVSHAIESIIFGLTLALAIQWLELGIPKDKR